MPNKIWKKSLVVGIILLLVGISVLSSVSSKDVSVSNEKIVENDVELEDIPVTSPTDNYREIITSVEAQVYDYWDVLIEKEGLLGKFPWFFGFYTLNIGSGDIKDIIQLKGIRFKKFGFPIFPIYEYFEVSATEVYSEWYHSGGAGDDGSGYGWYIWGTAFGDIDWS